MYEVQKGDNAQVISQKRYGTTKHWKAILKANPLLDFTRLKPGRVIKVPHDPENTQGIVVEAPTTPGTGNGDYVEYTVASGDTLMGIAKALYGKSSMWEEIRAANPSLDEDGTNLKPGMKLKVPPPTKGAGR
jgi:nucleoid-associated protein YgaU